MIKVYVNQLCTHISFISILCSNCFISMLIGVSLYSLPPQYHAISISHQSYYYVLFAFSVI